MYDETITSAKIMIIDDDIGMMDVLTAILGKYGHKISSFTEPVSAIETLKSNSFDILLVNYLMSPVNGDRIVELVREFNKEIYIILMSSHKDLIPSIETITNLDIQAYYEKSARFDQLILLIHSGIKYVNQVIRIKNMSIQIEETLPDFANVLLNTVEAKDHYTGDHSYRVSKYSEVFANYLNLSEEDTKSLILAAMFHDIGKIGINDSILLKEDKLTDVEYENIKLHTIIGANIFSVSNIFKDASPAIRGHHERYDGGGYPDKLKGDDIPYLARVLALCDTFDAIVAERPYKCATSIPFALDQIKKNIGSQFEPELAKEFIAMVNKNKKYIEEATHYSKPEKINAKNIANKTKE
ncbi:MAG: HD domain-containing protein [Clostridia bacterium]|nr:HD domain-containing protein [Clostridia bacterium]